MHDIKKEIYPHTNLKGISGKTKLVWGFTFIEILFVIMILGILAAGSFVQVKKNFKGMQLESFSRQLQSLMNYLHDRSVVEEEIILMDIDGNNKEYGFAFKGRGKRQATYRIPDDIRIESDLKEIMFYPDGTIDKFTLKIVSSQGGYRQLTTKGIFGYVKIQRP